ncbi:hypothetical protein ACH44C_33515 [Streptomyces purpureus]|uniref:hypothetical protein n=1 Tax=Streptomyces purpureus TaxID=1951 RepID=UPI0037B65978
MTTPARIPLDEMTSDALDQLYTELEELRLLIRMKDGMHRSAETEVTELHARAKQAEAAIERVRTLTTATRNATSAGRNDWQIGQHDLAITILAALDEHQEQPSPPAT